MTDHAPAQPAPSPSGLSYLITGGSGSFGQRLTRHLLDFHNPRRVLVYSRSEAVQAEMAQAFQYDRRLRWVIGDVRDRERLEQTMGGVQVVIHTAALKRVDAIAYNPGEVTKTNVLGTHHVCYAAIAAGVQKVLTISSDKAVHPTTSYGSSKQMAEHITIGANIHGYPVGTTLACVRYGNVLGSRGSVVGLFRECVKAGRPLPITDERMTRFWITFEQACKLVILALREMQGGEIFLPKLPTMRLMDLAEVVAPGHPWTAIGLRPGGEKLHERLLSDEEVVRTFDRGNHYCIAPNPHPWTAGEWTGSLVAPTFQYESATGYQLTPQELRTMLEGLP